MNSSSSVTIPEKYECPITGGLMKNPVIACVKKTGLFTTTRTTHTFEESAIREWRRLGNTTCPTCRNTLLSEFIPNDDLRESIEAFEARVKAGYTGPSASIPPSTVLVAPVAPVAPVASNSSSSSSSSSSGSKWAVKAERMSLNQVRVTLQSSVPDTEPLDVTVIFDSSGSMGTTVTINTPDGNVNMSMIWLAKHCVRCIARLLGSTARLSILNFNDTVTEILPLTRLTTGGIDEVDRCIRPIESGGTTDLFQALKRVKASSGRQITILLTDGQPNSVSGFPSFMEAVQAAQAKPWPVFQGTLHTIAFGNNLDSKLLQGLAAMSPGGRFFHSPSLNELGPVILGLIAAERVRATADGMLIATDPEIGRTQHIPIGPLYLGQERMHLLDDVAHLTLDGSPVEIGTGSLTIREDMIGLLQTCLALYETMQQKPAVVPAIERLLKDFHALYASSTDPATQAYMLDIHSKDASQGHLTLATKNMNTWGEPYFRAYLDGLIHRIPFNMMDPGLLGFLGTPMAEMRKTLQIDMLDVEAWPLVEWSVYGGTPNAAATAAAVTTYMTGGGGCFAPGTPISVPGGTKRIQDLKPGDTVVTPIGIATIRYVLQASTYDTTQPFCQITPGCLITEYHPYRHRITGKWRFPADDYPVLYLPIPTVFNLVLDQGHIVLVEGVECCTLAHGFKGFVIEHPFFGTDKVIEAMSGQPGFDKGLPVYQNMKAIRDTATKMIVNWTDAV